METILHIEKVSSDRTFDTFIVEGLSVEEMDDVLTAHKHGKDDRDVLVNVMNKYKNDSSYGQNIAEAWRCGYGIYGIRHFGGHLIITVGNSCD